MVKPQLLKSGQYRVQIRRKSVKANKLCATLEEAQQFIRDYEGDCPSFAVFTRDTYFDSTAFTLRKPSSQDAYRSRLKEVCKRLGDMPINKITTAVLDKYVTDRLRDTTRLGGPPANDTLRLELTAIYVVMRAAAKKSLITSNPVPDVDKPAPQRRRQRVSKQEKLNLWRAVKGDWPLPLTPKGKERGTGWALQTAARFLLIQSELGCRAGELASLPVLAVDFQNMEYHLTDTKTNVPQRRPLSPEAAALIREQLVAQAMFWRERGRGVALLFSLQKDPAKPYDYQYAVDLVREYKIVSPEYHSHANRRELVSDAIEREVPFEVIMAITGHASVDSMKKYDEALKLTASMKKQTNAFFAGRSRDLVATAKLAKETGGVVSLEHLHEDADLAGLDLMFQTPEAVAQQGKLLTKPVPKKAAAPKPADK